MTPDTCLKQVVHPGPYRRRLFVTAARGCWRAGAAVPLPRAAQTLAAQTLLPRLLLRLQQVADAVDQVQQQLVRVLQYCKNCGIWLMC